MEKTNSFPEFWKMFSAVGSVSEGYILRVGRWLAGWFSWEPHSRFGLGLMSIARQVVGGRGCGGVVRCGGESGVGSTLRGGRQTSATFIGESPHWCVIKRC